MTPAAALPFSGALAAAPAPLAVLLAEGTLAEVWVEPAAIVTRLGPGRSWRDDGARVRTALHAALDDPTGWIPAATTDLRRDDALLRDAAQRLIDGSAGLFARTHGGTIELVDVHHGVVMVRLGGACHGCPAARITMYQRLERHLRRQCPQLRQVTEASVGRG